MLREWKEGKGENCIALIACKYREISVCPVLIDFVRIFILCK